MGGTGLPSTACFGSSRGGGSERANDNRCEKGDPDTPLMLLILALASPAHAIPETVNTFMPLSTRTNGSLSESTSPSASGSSLDPNVRVARSPPANR